MQSAKNQVQIKWRNNIYAIEIDDKQLSVFNNGKFLDEKIICFCQRCNFYAILRETYHCYQLVFYHYI